MNVYIEMAIFYISLGKNSTGEKKNMNENCEVEVFITFDVPKNEMLIDLKKELSNVMINYLENNGIDSDVVNLDIDVYKKEVVE